MSATRPRTPSGASLCPGGRRRLLALIHRLLIGPACSTLAWLLRERESTSAMHGFLRRGGGLFAIATLSLLAGWLLPDLATLRAHLGDAPGGCFRIAWVARITTGEPEEPGPILLIQTAWRSAGVWCRPRGPLPRERSPAPAPALEGQHLRDPGRVLRPLVKPLTVPRPVPVPPDLCQRGGPRRTEPGSPRTQHRPA